VNFADKLRKFADFVDAHPVLEEIPELFGLDLNPERVSYGKHFTGEEAALLDRFAQIHGVAVTHSVHGPTSENPGARYTSVKTEINGIEFRMQAYTEDYEKATGKTVPLPPEEVERRMLAEVEHWSKTPLPGGAS
jgi:hypothetical protein